MASMTANTTTNAMTERKAALRSEILAKRNSIPEDARIEASLCATDHASAYPPLDDNFMPGTVVAGFHPIRSEIDPRPLMANLATKGARLCLPVVIDKTTIIFRELVRGSPMVETGFGTIGPDESAAVLNPEILLVPLSVFDAKGGRVGYGAGFYDRAITKLIAQDIRPALYGMAFTLQQTDIVPMEDHDIYLNAIITDGGIVETKVGK